MDAWRRGRGREGGRIYTVSLNTLGHVSVEGGTHMLCIEVEFHHWMVGRAGGHGKHAPLLHSPGELIWGGHHSQFQFHFVTADWEWESNSAGCDKQLHPMQQRTWKVLQVTHLSLRPNHFFSKSAEVKLAVVLSERAGFLSSASTGALAEKSKSPWGRGGYAAELIKVKGRVGARVSDVLH